MLVDMLRQLFNRCSCALASAVALGYAHIEYQAVLKGYVIENLQPIWKINPKSEQGKQHIERVRTHLTEAKGHFSDVCLRKNDDFTVEM